MKQPIIVPLSRLASTYSNQSAAVLRDMILTGQLRAGERINEVATATALGISRAPLREAIQTLANEGLITAIPNRGAFVRSFSEDELADLYELRIALELRALALANERASLADLRELDAMLTETGDRMDTEPAYPEELDFHRRLIALSRSAEIEVAAHSVNQRIRLARLRSGHQPRRAREAFGEHRQIVAMLGAHDLAQATELLTQHLKDSLASALALFRGRLDGHLTLQAKNDTAKRSSGPARTMLDDCEP
jgi:DNA-binding GntR family transcriptional regulator